MNNPREQPPPPVHPHFPPATAKPTTDEHQLVAGGDGDTSLLQPAWHPTSGALYFLSDASGWYNMQVLFSRPPIFSHVPHPIILTYLTDLFILTFF